MTRTEAFSYAVGMDAGLTAIECGVIVGCSPAAWYGRVRRGRAPADAGYCPRRGVLVWDPAVVLAYRARGRQRLAQPRYAGCWVRGAPVVEILAWSSPGPPAGPGFAPDAWRGRERHGSG